MDYRMTGRIWAASSVFVAAVLGSCAARNETSNVPSAPGPQYEREFLQNRVAHQQAALEMAQACIQKAQRDSLKRFCSSLSSTENVESKQLQSWLSQWYGLSVPPETEERATQGYRNFLESVRTQSGPPFERAFLSVLRLHHHEGVDESKMCQIQPVHNELRSLCAAMTKEQEREIKQLTAWICEWFKDCVER